jgi:hypothetical protein
MASGLTQPLAEMSNRNHLGSEALPASKADNLSSICFNYNL